MGKAANGSQEALVGQSICETVSVACTAIVELRMGSCRWITCTAPPKEAVT